MHKIIQCLEYFITLKLPFMESFFWQFWFEMLALSTLLFNIIIHERSRHKIEKIWNFPEITHPRMQRLILKTRFMTSNLFREMSMFIYSDDLPEFKKGSNFPLFVIDLFSFTFLVVWCTFNLFLICFYKRNYYFKIRLYLNL